MAKKKSDPVTEKPEAEQVIESPKAFDPDAIDAEEDAALLAELEKRDAELKAKGEAKEPGAADAPVPTSSGTEPPPVSDQPKPTVHKHSRRLLKEALEWGFTQAHIDNTASEELDDQLYEKQRNYRIAHQRWQEEQAKEAREKLEQAKLPEKDDEPFSEADYADFDEPSKKALRKRDQLSLDLKKELAEVKRQLKEREEQDQRRQLASVQRRFNALWSKHKDVFPEDAAGKARRDGLLGYMRGLERDNADGLEDDFAEGMKLLGFSKSESPAAPTPKPKAEPDEDDEAVAELNARKELFAKAGVAKSGGPSEEMPFGNERAYRNLGKRLKEQREVTDEDFLASIGHGPVNGRK